MADPTGIAIRRADCVGEDLIRTLAEIVIDATEDGAGIGFMFPLGVARAEAFWRVVSDEIGRGERALLVAEDEAGVVGTVQLILKQPDNQPHRADLAKLVVLRRARQLGVATALVHAAEATARDCGKTLLVLDTWTDSDAARLYKKLVWVRVGEIPRYAIPARGDPAATTVFYKELDRPPD